jgi:hypothetical protein
MRKGLSMISNYSLLPNVEPSIAKTIALKSLITKQLSGGMKNTDEINKLNILYFLVDEKLLITLEGLVYLFFFIDEPKSFCADSLMILFTDFLLKSV